MTGGTLEVSGSTSEYELVIGEGGSGSVMNILSGAHVSLSGDLTNAVLGNEANIVGTANVSGAGAVWANASDDSSAPLVIGGFGSGFLNILSGGQVNDFDADIGRETGSSGSVDVDGSGSLWTSRDELIIGAAGTGSLTVSNGGQVTNQELTVGGTSTGMLTISSGGVVNDGSSGIGGAQAQLEPST